MIDKEINLFLEIWDTVKVYIPQKEKIEAAQHVLQMLDEYGIDVEEHSVEMSDHCAILEKAVKEILTDYDDLVDDME
jgi:putative heme degradation protein